MFALQPDEAEFIHNCRALTPGQYALLKTMARTLSRDVTPVIVLAPGNNVSVLFPEHRDEGANGSERSA
jgi:hypothetical protein